MCPWCARQLADEQRGLEVLRTLDLFDERRIVRPPPASHLFSRERMHTHAPNLRGPTEFASHRRRMVRSFSRSQWASTTSPSRTSTRRASPARSNARPLRCWCCAHACGCSRSRSACSPLDARCVYRQSSPPRASPSDVLLAFVPAPQGTRSTTRFVAPPPSPRSAHRRRPTRRRVG